jgi:tetratricopeptide (TPR) repeat protein
VGPKLLVLRPTDAAVIRGLALACQQRGFDDVALRYWTLAAELLPKDVEVQRRAGMAFSEQGHFGQAMRCWTRVRDRQPKDPQACELLELYQSLHPAGDQQREAANDGDAPLAVSDYLERATHDAAAGHLLQAQQWIEKALTVSPGDQTLREQLQQYKIMVAEQKFRTAEKQAQCLKTKAAMELAAGLEEDWRRQELDVAYDLHRRTPEDAERRLHLARLLKQHRRFEEAIALLDKLPPRQGSSPREQLELGECLQHLHRFDQALDCYRTVIQNVGTSPDPPAKLARWRGASLALAMGDAKSALAMLEQLLAIDPSYPGAADKLAEACHLLRSK